MLVLACLVSLILIPMLALRGLGYRGLYFACALAALISGGLALSLPGGVGLDAPPIELRGTEAVDAFAPAVGIWLVVTGLGFVLAGSVFREPALRPDNSAR